MAVNARLRKKSALDRKGAALTLTGALRTLRHHLLIRVSVVALLMLSWVILTNHCALGLMRPMAETTGSSANCCGGKTNPPHDAPVSLRSCCNVKVTTAPAKAEVKFDASKFAFQVFAPVHVLAAHQTERGLTLPVFDHGPPRAVSFTESVLQRSLLSHAPPFAV